jgi:hypothetical protein
MHYQSDRKRIGMTGHVAGIESAYIARTNDEDTPFRTCCTVVIVAICNGSSELCSS